MGSAIMIKKSFLLFFSLATIFFSGCRAVYEVDRSERTEQSIVFTRPARFTPFFGSHSLSEFVEITYEKVSRNQAGQLVVEAGIRNRGPVGWADWYKDAPEQITLKTRCAFFNGVRVLSPAIYSTNQQEIVIGRGETYYYRAVCPDTSASDYQLILGD